MAGAGASVSALLTPAIAARPASAASARAIGRAQPFDAGWRFRRGDSSGAQDSTVDDRSWQRIDLPHDWSIEDFRPVAAAVGEVIGPFYKRAAGGTVTGFSMGGEGWYRKHFKLDLPPGGRAEVLFEGVYRNSDVWLNGHHLGSRASGYTAFAYDLTPHLLKAGENLLVVRVRNIGENSRWYSGSGIYRHVWLDVTTEQTRIARWGVGVTTRRILDSGATIEIATQVEDVVPGLTLVSRIRDETGRIVWEASASTTRKVRQVATIVAPRLWSPEAPTTYRLETELRRGAAVLDRETTPFGIRIITFDVANGMRINGVATLLRGGCIHHDNGLLGAASFDAAEERKVALLKERGYNAVRCSHNPFSPAFLRACDRHGLLVIVEAFDAWRATKVPQDYAVSFDADWQADLAAMVLSARNHPSVLMWSIGNEIPKRNRSDGIETQWRLANAVHALDPSRPVTAAINAFAGRLVIPDDQTARPGFAGVPDEASTVFLDITGYNYKFDRYDRDHQRFPNRIIYGSESFPKDMFEIWARAGSTPHVLGDFVWTAIDYLGEAGIGGSVYEDPSYAQPGGPPPAWPEVVSSCGELDLIGRQKAASLARDVVWGLSDLEIAVQKPPPAGMVEVVRLWGWSDERPSWTWFDAHGRPVRVNAYTTGDRVELWLNGALVASKPVHPVDRKRVEFQLPYVPGELVAIAFRDGQPIARRELHTAGTPFAIHVVPESRTGGAGIGDVSFVGIEVRDARGRVVGDTVRDLTLSISGPASLAALGNANPVAHGGFQSRQTQSWDGRALAVLRGTGERGLVRIEVRSAALRPGVATVLLA